MTTAAHIGPIENEVVYAYPESAVLKPAQVMEWLQIGPKVFEFLPIRCIRLGPKTRRYLAKHVLEFLDGEGNYPL